MTMRLYVRGWVQPVSEQEVRKRFEGFPGIVSVSNVCMNAKRFAHVDLQLSLDQETVLAKLQSTYRNAKWRGGNLQFEVSKPEYKIRLVQEATEEDDRKMKDKEELERANEEEKREYPEELRIQGRGKIKRAKVIVFNDDDEDTNTYVPNPLLDSIKEGTTKIPKSQDPAYCCIDTEHSDTIIGSEPLRNKELPKRTKLSEPERDSDKNTKPKEHATPAPGANRILAAEPVKPDLVNASQKSEPRIIDVDSLPSPTPAIDDDGQDTSALSKFVKEHHAVPSKSKKNASRSLLGTWFASSPNVDSNT